jgi:hypothetical protein
MHRSSLRRRETTVRRFEFIDPTDPERPDVINSAKSHLEGLLATVRKTQESISAFRAVILKLQQTNVARELNRAYNRLLTAIDSLFASYEEIESFGLKVAFRMKEKFGSE